MSYEHDIEKFLTNGGITMHNDDEDHEFVPILFQQQVVDGVNYRIKIKVADDDGDDWFGPYMHI